MTSTARDGDAAVGLQDRGPVPKIAAVRPSGFASLYHIGAPQSKMSRNTGERRRTCGSTRLRTAWNRGSFE